MVSIIVILSSEPGKGKTWQGMKFEEPIRILDLENRDTKTKNLHYPDNLIDIRPLMQIIKGKRDYYASYLVLKKEIDSIIEGKNNDNDFETLIIDGISDIRGKYAKAKWFHDHPTRKNPRSEEWTEINGTTNGLLEPMVDMAMAGNFHLMMTAQFCDQYGKVTKIIEGKQVVSSEKLGREPGIENWQEYGAETVIQLEYRPNKKQYWAVCTKSYVGCWELDITDKSLYDELVNLGV